MPCLVCFALPKQHIGKPGLRTRTEVILQLRSAFTADYVIKSAKKPSSEATAPLRSSLRILGPGAGLPIFCGTPSHKNRRNEEANDCSTAIDSNVPYRRAAGRHKRLVEFICDGYKQTHSPDTQTKNRHRPFEIRHAIRSTKQEKCQNGVLTDVRALPDHEMNGRSCRRGNIRVQPM